MLCHLSSQKLWHSFIKVYLSGIRELCTEKGFQDPFCQLSLPVELSTLAFCLPNSSQCPIWLVLLHHSIWMFRIITYGLLLMVMNLYSAFSIDIFKCTLQASDLWVRSDISIHVYRCHWQPLSVH